MDKSTKEVEDINIVPFAMYWYSKKVLDSPILPTLAELLLRCSDTLNSGGGGIRQRQTLLDKHAKWHE